MGTLTAIIMVVSSLAVVTVVPAIVMLAKPRFLWRGVMPLGEPSGQAIVERQSAS